MEYPNRDELPETSLHDLATIIFTSPANPPNSQQVLIQQVIEYETNQIIDVFEIFLTLLVEGLMIIHQNPTWNTVKLFNEEVLLNLNPWLKSLGFVVHVQTLDRKNDRDQYNNYYCKVLLNCDPEWSMYFKMKNIVLPYTFIFGANSPYITHTPINLTTLFAIFICDDNVYKITFSYHI